jgi:hypothetical protein
MLFKSLYFILLVFFSFSLSSIVFVIITAYSYDNIGLSEKNKTPIDHVIVISQGRRSLIIILEAMKKVMVFQKM